MLKGLLNVFDNVERNVNFLMLKGLLNMCSVMLKVVLNDVKKEWNERKEDMNEERNVCKNERRNKWRKE